MIENYTQHDEQIFNICRMYLKLDKQRREQFIERLRMEELITDTQYCELLQESEGM